MSSSTLRPKTLALLNALKKAFTEVDSSYFSEMHGVMAYSSLSRLLK